MPNLGKANAMPSGPVPLSTSSKALATKEFSYIVQRAQIQQRKRAKHERRIKRQKALEVAEARAAAQEAEEEFARTADAAAAAAAASMMDGESMNGENIVVVPPPDLDGFGAYADDMDWGVQEDDFDGGGDYDNDNDQEGDPLTTNASDAASYAQLCRAHVAAYMRGTHQYAQETNLTRRVTDWEDKLLPVLEDQVQRPQFDIHECGAQLLDTLSLEVASNVNEQTKRDAEEMERDDMEVMNVESGEQEEEEEEEGSGQSKKSQDEKTKVDDIMAPQFVKLARKQKSSRYEVCRLFLSMLQLANNRNVELMHDTVDQLPESVLMHDMDTVADHLTESLRVRLLSNQRAVEFNESAGFADFQQNILGENGAVVVLDESEVEMDSGGGSGGGGGLVGKTTKKRVIKRGAPLASINGNSLVE